MGETEPNPLQLKLGWQHRRRLRGISAVYRLHTVLEVLWLYTKLSVTLVLNPSNSVKYSVLYEENKLWVPKEGWWKVRMRCEEY